jgi:hypothetical protein
MVLVMERFLILVCALIAFSACAGNQNVLRDSPQDSLAAAGVTGAAETARIPIKEAGEPGPRSLAESYASGYWITRPSGGTIRLVGIAGRRRDRDAAVAAALADAALKAALYHGVYGESAAVLNQGSGSLDYYADFDYRLTLDNSPESFINDLTFDKDTDILEKDGAVYVWAQYSGVPDVPTYPSVFKDGVPDWVKNYTALVPGFLVGIGTSKNKGSPQKTYQASYENAVVSILPGLATQVRSDSLEVTGGKLTTNTTASRGSLINVMILETWFDRKTGSVWTLLAARQKPE